MAVKLKGVTANTKPSSGLSSRVEDAGCGSWLEMLGEGGPVVRVEAQEVDELANGVDLRLVDGLALTEHGGGVHALPSGTGDHVGGSQEDPCSVVVGHTRPRPSGLLGGFDGVVDVALGGTRGVSEAMRMAMRHHHRIPLAAHALRVADEQRDVDRVAHERLQHRHQLPTFRAPRRVVEDSLVVGARQAFGGHADDGGKGHSKGVSVLPTRARASGRGSTPRYVAERAARGLDRRGSGAWFRRVVASPSALSPSCVGACRRSSGLPRGHELTVRFVSRPLRARFTGVRSRGARLVGLGAASSW